MAQMGSRRRIHHSRGVVATDFPLHSTNKFSTAMCSLVQIESSSQELDNHNVLVIEFGFGMTTSSWFACSVDNWLLLHNGLSALTTLCSCRNTSAIAARFTIRGSRGSGTLIGKCDTTLLFRRFFVRFAIAGTRQGVFGRAADRRRRHGSSSLGSSRNILEDLAKEAFIDFLWFLLVLRVNPLDAPKRIGRGRTAFRQIAHKTCIQCSIVSGNLEGSRANIQVKRVRNA